MENHHFNGKIHYFYGPFSIAMLVHQRVTKKKWLKHVQTMCNIFHNDNVNDIGKQW